MFAYKEKDSSKRKDKLQTQVFKKHFVGYFD